MRRMFYYGPLSENQNQEDCDCSKAGLARPIPRGKKCLPRHFEMAFDVFEFGILEHLE